MNRPDHHPRRVVSSGDAEASSALGAPERCSGPGVAGRADDPRISGRTPSGTARRSVVDAAAVGTASRPGAAAAEINPDGAAVASGFVGPAGPAVRTDPAHRRRITQANGAAGEAACSLGPEGATGPAEWGPPALRSVTAGGRPGVTADRLCDPAPAAGAVPNGPERTGCPVAAIPFRTGPAGPVGAVPWPARAAPASRPAHRRRRARV